MTKKDYEIVYKLIDTLLNQKLGNYSNATKTAAEFEDMYMREYAGGAAIDHVLFRRFLRQLEVVKGELSERLIELENLDITNIYTDLADIEHPQENYGYFLLTGNKLEIKKYTGSNFVNIFTIDSAFDEDSVNPLENGVITKRFDNVETDLTDHGNRVTNLETQVQQNTSTIDVLGRTYNIVNNKVRNLQTQIDQIGVTQDKEVVVLADYQALQDYDNPQTEVLYVLADNQDIYIWDGQQYVQINTSAGSGTNIEVVTDLTQAYTRTLGVGNYIIDLIKDAISGGFPQIGRSVKHEYYNLKVNSDNKTLFSTLGWAEWENNDWSWHYYAYRGSGGGSTDIAAGENITISQDEQTGIKTITAKGYHLERGMMAPNTTLNVEHGIIAFNNQSATKVYTTNGQIRDISELVPAPTIDHNFDEDSVNPLENGTITKRFDDDETQITQNENDIIDLKSRTTQNETDISDLQSQVGQNTIAISEIGEAGTTLQTQVQNIQNTINQQTLIPAETEIITVSTEQDLDELPSTDKKQDAIYITEDTNDIYVYDGEQFINKTGEQINGKIVVNTYAQLRALTTRTLAAGNYDVLYTYKYRAFDTQSHLWKIKTSQTSYTLFVPANSSQKRVLNNYDGWAENYNDNGTWDWNWHTYIYEQSLTQKFQIDPDENDRIYIKPNALYELQTPLTALEIRFETSDQSVGVDTADEYIVRFTIDTNYTQGTSLLTFNAANWLQTFGTSSPRWHDQTPTWVAGATYELSILDGYIICAQFN